MRLVSFSFPHIHTHPSVLELGCHRCALKRKTHTPMVPLQIWGFSRKKGGKHTHSLVSALRSRRYQHKASIIATESHDKSSSDKCSGGIDFSHEDYHLCFWERKWEFDTFWWVLPIQEVMCHMHSQNICRLLSATLIVSFEYRMVLHRDALVKSFQLCVCVCVWERVQSKIYQRCIGSLWLCLSWIGLLWLIGL